ncbi:MAG: elongation factor P [Ignavibacteriae bacterium]|nr:elongation factor P [Ignavibacteriota bacterium]
MILASEVKAGAALMLDNRLYKVLEVVRHAGSGQMHGFIELKLHDLRYGHFADRRFKHSDRFEEVDLRKRPMDFLYADDMQSYFMDPDSFEQVGIAQASLGEVRKFLREGMRITVELLNDEAVSVQFPKVIDLKIASTGTGLRGEHDNTLKSARLENGLEILVPQFVETGDVVRVDTEKVKYIDRVKR